MADAILEISILSGMSRKMQQFSVSLTYSSASIKTSSYLNIFADIRIVSPLVGWRSTSAFKATVTASGKATGFH